MQTAKQVGHHGIVAVALAAGLAGSVLFARFTASAVITLGEMLLS